MRKHILVVILALYNIIATAQEQQALFTAPDNWQKEVIPFPLSFAPAIDYTGYEDLRFTPGWSKKDDDQLWTYTFAWYVDKHEPLTDKSLSKTLQLYFDGLMGIDVKDAPDAVKQYKTVATISKANEGFKGSIKVYDAFFSKQPMLLYVTVKETYCPRDNKQLILFRFSQKDFTHAVWNVFNEVRVFDCK